MRDLVRASSLLALRQAVIGALGVVRVKVVAVLLGPAGMGLVAQATQLSMLTGRLANLGLSNGVVKYTAQYAATGRRQDLERLLGGARWAVAAASVILAALLWGGRHVIAGWIFGGPRYAVALVLVAIATPFAAQGDTAVFALRGARAFRALAVAGLAVAAASVVITVPLVAVLGLHGAFWAIPVVAIATYVILRIALVRGVLAPRGLTDRFRVPDPVLMGALAGYGVAVLASGLSDVAAELVVRSSLVHRLGGEANGFYHASWNVGSQFSALLGSSLATWGLPTMAGLEGDPLRVNRVRNDLLRAYLLAGVPLAVAALLTSALWIPLLFSGRFLPAGRLLTWQLAAQVVLGVRAMLNTSLWAHRRLRVFTILTLAQTAVYLALYFWLVDPLGVIAAPIAFLCSQVAVLVPTGGYLHRVESMRLDRRTARLAVTSAVLVGVWLVALPNLRPGVAHALVGAATLSWMVTNLRRRDLQALWSEIRRLAPGHAEA